MILSLPSDSIDAINGHSRIATLAAEVASVNPMHKGFVNRALPGLTSQELARFEQFLEFCERGGTSVEYIASCYLTVVEDTLGEEMYFLRHKNYRHSTYLEVAAFVYHNRDYMSRYMYGLVVTSFLWPNHVRMARFFKEKLPFDKCGAYLEIGPGHGYYMMTAVSESAFDRFVGVDISEASIAQTQAMIDFFAPQASGRIELSRCDFLDATTLTPASFDAIVMGEVLEHVECPCKFLCRIAELSRPGAFIYVTTCINAPAVDHIYLWRTTDELEQLFMECGFSIEEALRLPYVGRTLEQAAAQALSINVAYVLGKE
jgi:2-polyprenyl-3-methyl-5-hydroxy-6-metoxy-1,4-benzoquinol methylase